ncbi:MAG: hypothetical protein RIQ94_3145 [Pseudomonadota bacterium]|jgi:hypothetical protein
MWDNFELLAVILAWLIHTSAIFALAWQGRNKSYECQVIVTLYLFASIAPLFPFEFQHFHKFFVYSPSVIPILLYIVTDIFMLLFVRYVFTSNTLSNKKATVWSLEMQFGFKILLLIAMLAQCINVIFNFNLLFLPKNEFIFAIDTGIFTPNLFVYNIPADSLLIGGLLFNPFKNKGMRYLLIVLAVITVFVSFMQGYRHLLLFLVLILFFRWRIRGGILLVVVTLSLIGEMTNPLKYLIGGVMTTPDFQVLEFIEYQLTNINELFGLSGEQKAILINLIIGLDNIQIGAPLPELYNLIPFTNSLAIGTETGASKIGQIVGTDIGQGTGYCLQLFALETLFLGLIFFGLVMFFIKKFAQSMFAVISIELFFSILRNTPEFWSGQIKMFYILIAFVYCIAMVGQKYGQTT